MPATLNDVKRATIMAYQGKALEATTANLFWDLPMEDLQRKIGYSGNKRININAACLNGDPQVVGIKNIPSNPENPKKFNAPRASGLITLVDFETGYPYALMDAAIINGFRTGALAGMGAEFLAPDKPCVVGLIGAGPINRAALRAVKDSAANIASVKIFDLDPDRSSAFSDDLSSELLLNIEVASSAKDAISDADIIMPATNVTVPEDAYLKYSWLKPGLLLIDLSLWDEEVEIFQKADKLIVNSSLALKRDNITPGSLIRQGYFSEESFIDIGSVIHGERAGRENNEEMIVYFPRGMAIYDVINAKRVYETAKEKGIGQKLSLWKKPHLF